MAKAAKLQVAGGLRRTRLVFRLAPKPHGDCFAWSRENWGWATVKYFWERGRFYREIVRNGVSSFAVQIREPVPESGGVPC